ncbi:conserved hypothetical protein [Sporisorium reilianum SRZ2]|uniref:Uncharacterized protein n=1 Tax=Sporisorium reilianum (strain SRZ2) TaxID=999809 RepID=E6ZKT0_SPORE|nr:conserved hypothetical protein [Sporisorium reilianum SRZ2]
MQTFSTSTTSLPLAADAKPKPRLLKRLSLKPKKPMSVTTGSDTASLASPPSSRRAFDLFSSAPSTPRTPKTPKTSSGRSIAPSTRATSASMDAMRASSSRFAPKDAPPVPTIPKVFLISDEVFVIAVPPKAPEVREVREVAPRPSESSSAPSTYSRLSSTPTHTSNSWVDNLGSPAQDDVATFKPEPLPEPVAEATRTSLDEIDDQIVLNLCMNLCDEQAPARREAPKERRAHRRSASLRAQASFTPPAHTRMASAPLSLGPLPPQPTQPPTEAVLRKTDQIKKRYSKQSPLLTCASPLIANDEAAVWSSPRAAPGTPKLDSISSLKTLEAGLSLDSKLAKRNHRRSASKRSVEALPSVRLTRGHVDAPFFEPAQEELVSRFSEDSDDEARGRFAALLSPRLGTVARFTSPFSSSSSAVETMRWDSTTSGTRTPDMVATRTSSSSSSTSSLSDLSDFPTADDAVFDLSSPSLDYRAVYALAQKYASNAVPQPQPQLARSTSVRKEARPSAMCSILTPAGAKDPLDRTYHLRKY